MRLIYVKTLQLEQFFDDVPPYAILLHTWEREEITFQDIADGRDFHRQKIGFHKIARCCMLADANGYNFAWVDTCCIDKSSSAELSEALNSMYRWYQNAAVCFVFMSDYSIPDGSYVRCLD